MWKLFIIIWQSTDDETGKDTAEFYGDIPVFFDAEDTGKLKRIVWQSFTQALKDCRVSLGNVTFTGEGTCGD